MSELLQAWTMPSSWFGKPWDGYYIAGFGRNRDSDVLENCNFDVAWEALSAVSERVEIVHEGHWAVGWIEWVAIPMDDSEAIKVACELNAAMADYPVLDEGRFSEAEWEEANRVWEKCYDAKERLQYIRDNRSQFEFHSFADILGCVRGKYFAGSASELLT
jgi:hypothetical protein